MERAARLLLTTNARVAMVAEEVGILDVNYFTKMFKSATGQTPTALPAGQAGPGLAGGGPRQRRPLCPRPADGEKREKLRKS